jgi:hypothetical protein
VIRIVGVGTKAKEETLEKDVAFTQIKRSHDGVPHPWNKGSGMLLTKLK